MQVNGSLPALLNRVYLLFFHGWNTIEAGHVHTEGEMRMECGVGASSCCCCCFSFSLPLAPFYSRSRRVCYPVVGASRKPQAVCVPQTEEDEERRRKEKKKNPFHSAFEPYFSFSLQSNDSTFSLFFYMYSWIRYIITAYFLFFIFSPSFFHLLCLIPYFFSTSTLLYRTVSLYIHLV